MPLPCQIQRFLQKETGTSRTWCSTVIQLLLPPKANNASSYTTSLLQLKAALAPHCHWQAYIFVLGFGLPHCFAALPFCMHSFNFICMSVLCAKTVIFFSFVKFRAEKKAREQGHSKCEVSGKYFFHDNVDPQALNTSLSCKLVAWICTNTWETGTWHTGTRSWLNDNKEQALEPSVLQISKYNVCM